MKTIYSLLFIFLFLVPALAYSSTRKSSMGVCENSYGSTYRVGGEERDFRKFADSFFIAVVKKDTNFLKKHVIFPIVNSSFGIFDSKIKENTKIDSKLFFKNLSRFFPKHYLLEIPTAEYFISKQKGYATEYIIAIYHDNDGVDSNAKWFFVKRKGVFYFKNFLTEVG